ncbi:glycosyltransferase family 2 protein [Mangrovibacterium lignilyticum]|uniref:glycosyltransferase family 2 protein n=1 Tax=Mangrovibacterium lignilyticum TaxID=2668052 RepID=UPI0013D32890|nr:glycosyltransferase [Mangrovibacterium lignilyticum]
MDIIAKIISFWVESFIFYYTVAIFLVYFVLAIISAFVLRRFYLNGKIADHNEVLSSPFAPSISILAPAFNESLNIVENIKALLALHYTNFEVVVINDGSGDDTLQTAIEAFDLEKVHYVVDERIFCSEIRGVYKSRKRALNNLTIVDKVNGGKADALNAGLNIAKGKYFIAIDADSIIDPHALQKMVKPFLEESDKQVIATGGVIRIANSCEIVDGHLVNIKLPDKILPLFQVLEYNRAFLLGRLAWSKLNGLLIISGALGLFDKEIVIACGGYHRYTVGEDMELVVRMRRYMTDNNKPYRVEYLPDPLCWTEAPGNLNVLIRQRNRWTRGTIETLFSHWNVFLNPKYGMMGLVSHPFWVMFEWMAPIVELFGIVYFVTIALLGFANWPYFFVTLFFVYFFSISFTSYAILYDHIAFFRYKSWKMVFRQLAAALVEPFFFHPLILYAAIKGNFDYFVLRKRSWGNMARVGLANTNKKKKQEEKVIPNVKVP